MSDWSTSDALNVSMVAEDDAGLTYTGTWQTESSTAYFGGAETYSLSAGDSVSYTFTGSSFAWVGKKASNRGAADVYVDGTLMATVDTHRSSGLPAPSCTASRGPSPASTRSSSWLSARRTGRASTSTASWSPEGCETGLLRFTSLHIGWEARN